MTNRDKQYIRNNRLNCSMLDMAAHLDLPYNRVRNFMIENNIQVDKATVMAIKSKKIKSVNRDRNFIRENNPLDDKSKKVKSKLPRCTYGRRIF